MIHYLHMGVGYKVAIHEYLNGSLQERIIGTRVFYGCPQIDVGRFTRNRSIGKAWFQIRDDCNSNLRQSEIENQNKRKNKRFANGMKKKKKKKKKIIGVCLSF